MTLICKGEIPSNNKVLNKVGSVPRMRIVLTCVVGGILVGCATPPPVAPPIVTPVVIPAQALKRAPIVGLALGGGAARGFAHVGVIQALEEGGIKVDMVLGTSAGSLVAALYASGKTAGQLHQTALAMDEAAITDWTLPLFNRGVLKGEALARYVNQQVNNKLIESMPMRLGIVVTDLKTGAGVTFGQGDTGMAVRASSAVPTVFLPVKIGQSEYVDGGLVAPVPVSQARAMGAELVIAVDISSSPEGNAVDNPIQVLLQTTAIMGRSINTYALREADVVVRPALAGVKGADFSSKQRSIDAGKAAMQAAMPQLRRLLVDKRVELPR